MARRIGISGGTFDPPHIGHLQIAVDAVQSLDLDEVWLVVNADPWQKSGSRLITTAAVRLEMTQRAVAELLDATMSVSVKEFETRRAGPTYTIDTVRDLQAQYPEDEFVLILGQDAANGLDSWFEAEKLCELIDIAIACRPGFEKEALRLAWRIQSFVPTQIDVSSTDLRRRFSDGVSTGVLVAPSTRSLVASYGLYGVHS